MANDTAGGSGEEAKDPVKPRQKKWLEIIKHSQKCFATYFEKCDNIKGKYANLEKMADTSGDRQFQIFWANLEVLKPSIYSRPPVPVVKPRHRRRNPLLNHSSEILQRSLSTTFDMERIQRPMKRCRDAVALYSRGVLWLRYQTNNDANVLEHLRQRVCFEWVRNRDFLHDICPQWDQVDWVARRTWLNKEDAKKRFGKKAQHLEYKQPGKEGEGDAEERKEEFETKAEIWEIWCKSENKVHWVSPGGDNSVSGILDTQDPPVDLEEFFPCPEPAYGTLEPDSLMPVPDYVFYRDQLDEVDQLTARIHALSEAVRVKGFYPGGVDQDVSDALETAFMDQDDRVVLVPIAAADAFGNNALKDSVIFWPVEKITATIRDLVLLRQQIIEDIYQITGLSDIMRGVSDPNETKGAQELKAQFGSVRVKDKQEELVRIARDATKMAAEIISENFTIQNIYDIAQYDELPLQKQIEEQIAGIQEGMMIAVQKAPQSAAQIQAQAQQDLKQFENVTTFDQAVQILKDERARPFDFDIQTDSTIQPDEEADKQRRNEYVTVVGTTLQQAGPIIEANPAFADYLGEVLKFQAEGYRVGRGLSQMLDEAIEKTKQMLAQRANEPSPEELEAQAEEKQAQREHEQTMEKMRLDHEAAEADKQRAHALKLAKEANETERRDHDKQRLRVEEEFNKEKLEIEKMKVKKETNGQLVEAGLPPDYSFEHDREHFKEIMSTMQVQQQLLMELFMSMKQQNAAIVTALTAPKQVVRDQNGRPIGVETKVVN